MFYGSNGSNKSNLTRYETDNESKKIFVRQIMDFAKPDSKSPIDIPLRIVRWSQ